MSSYFIRITPHSDIHTLGTISFVIDQLNPSKYIIGVETEPRKHFHVGVWGVKRSPESLRAFLRTRIEGQVYISGKEITNKISAIAYCLKEGHFVQKGLDINDFLMSVSQAKPKIKYDNLLEKAEDAYDGDDKKYLGQLIEAHVKTNKKVYMPHIKAQLLLTKLKKDKYGTYKEYLIDKIIDNM